MKKQKEEKVKVKSDGPKMIMPLKSIIFRFQGIVYDIKEGEEISIPEALLQNLKTEKVIK